MPGLAKWITALIADCLGCQTNKDHRKDLQTAPLQEWSTMVPAPFHTVHIDYKGPLTPASHSCTYCLVCIDAFSNWIQVFPAKKQDGATTIRLFQKEWIFKFGIPQFIVTDRGTEFMNHEFIHWAEDLGIGIKPRTPYAPWTNGKVENQNNVFAKYLRNFLNESKTNWSELTAEFSFAANTTTIDMLGKTPYEIVFGQKPIVPMSLKLGAVRNTENICRPRKNDFCHELPVHSHSDFNDASEFIRQYLRPEFSD